jgi:hypothetical protein
MASMLERVRASRLVVAAMVLALMNVAAPALAGGATVDRVEGPFETVVPVAEVDNDIGVELMFAECDFVQRVEKPDGSATETESCHVTGPFVVFPGEVPDQAFTNVAGACLWASDYWTQSTGDIVIADSARITVTPSGNVHITSTYPAEPIPLSDCGIE